MHLIRWFRRHPWIVTYWPMAILAISVVISFLRGIRFSNQWAATHYCFNYQEGFIKRGLVGQLNYSLFGSDYCNYTTLFTMHVSILLVFLGLMLWWFWHVIRLAEQKLALTLLASLFLASPAMVMHVHAIGYFEQIILILLMAQLLLWPYLTASIRVVTAIAMVVIAILVHEATIFLVVPVLCLRFISAQKKFLLPVISIVVVAAGMTYVVSEYGILPEERWKNLEGFVSGMANFRLCYPAFWVLKANFTKNHSSIVNDWMTKYQKEFIACFVMIVPFLIATFWYALRRINGAKYQKIGFMGLLVTGSLAPSLLATGAWDFNRWAAWCATNAILGLLIFAEDKHLRTPAQPLWKGRDIVNALAFCWLFYFGFSHALPMFDGYEAKNWPFTEHWDYLAKVYEGKAQFPDVPRRRWSP